MIIQFKKDYSKYKKYASVARDIDRIEEEIRDIQNDINVLIMTIDKQNREDKYTKSDNRVLKKLGKIKYFQYKSN